MGEALKSHRAYDFMYMLDIELAKALDRMDARPCSRCGHSYRLHSNLRLKKDGKTWVAFCRDCLCMEFAKDNLEFVEQEAKKKGL